MKTMYLQNLVIFNFRVTHDLREYYALQTTQK